MSRNVIATKMGTIEINLFMSVIVLTGISAIR